MHGSLTNYLKWFMKTHNDPINADPAKHHAGLDLWHAMMFNT